MKEIVIRTGILFIISTLLLMAGCSANAQKILGEWELRQVTQVEGLDNLLTHSNQFNFKADGTVLLTREHKSYREDEEIVLTDGKEKTLVYQWSQDGLLDIGGAQYDVEIKRKQLTLSNDEFELLFTRK